MGATIEGIQVAFGATGLDTLGAGVSATDSTLAGLGATADVLGASLTSMADKAIAVGGSLDGLSASASADGEAMMALSDIMAQLNSMAEEQVVAITSDGEAMATLGSVMADLDAFAAQTTTSMQGESDAAAYLAMMAEKDAEAFYAAADAAAAASAALDTTAASADAVGASAGGAALGMDTLKKAATGIGIATLAVGALGVASLKMAGDFQSGVTGLATGAGELKSNLDADSAGMLNLSTATGTTTSALVQGMFMINSAGQHGAAALLTLQDAAEGAKVGQADLGVVANGVTTIMTDYANKNVTAAQATNDLLATVANGKTHMQDLAQAMATILPTSSAAKVSLYDVSGAMATMTGEGVPAADAATYLRQMLMSLDNPSKQAKDALASIGLTSSQVAADMQKSLPDTLKMIEDHLGQKFPVGSSQYMAALAAISGGTKQMQGMLDLTGSHLQTFEGNVSSISEAVKKGGANIQGWSDVQKDFNFSVDKAKASLEVLGITIGSKLLPFIGPLISNISNGVSAFSAWINSGHAVSDSLSLTGKYAQTALPILAGLGALVAGILVPVFWSWASATIAATWPILAVAAAVAGLVAGFVLLYQHVAPFRQFIDNLVTGFKQVASYVQANFLPAMKMIGDWFRSNVLPVLQQIGGFILSSFAPVWKQLVDVWNNSLLPSLKRLWSAVQDLMPVFKLIGGLIVGVIAAQFIVFVGVISGLSRAIANVVAGVANIFAGFVQMWSGVFETLGGIVQFFIDLFTGKWSKLGGDLGKIGDGIKNIFAGMWKEVQGIFQATFGALIGYVSGFWDGILGLFTHGKVSVESIWQGMMSAIGGFFSGLGTNIHNIIGNIVVGVGNFFSGLGTIVHNGIMAVVNFFVNGFQTVAGWFTWLYNHNYIFQALVDTIRKIVDTGIKVLTTIWNDFVKGVTIIWGLLSGAATKAWDAVHNAVMAVVNPIIGWLKSVWNGAVNNLSNQWHTLTGIAKSVWDNVTGAFRNAWGGISGALGGLWKNISGWFSNLANQAIQWGQNLIKSIIQGIQNMLGALGNALGNVASKIANVLGFHSPAKEGPGRELDAWPRNMMRSYASGIEDSIPLLSRSLNLVMQPVASSLSNGAALGSSQPVIVGGGSNNNANRPVNVWVDGRFVGSTMTDHVGNAMLSEFRSMAHPVGGI